MRFSALVSKMPFLIIIVTGNLIQFFVFLLQYPFPVPVFPGYGLSCIDHSGRVEALRSGATKTRISFFIALTLLVVLTKFLRGFNTLKIMRR